MLLYILYSWTLQCVIKLVVRFGQNQICQYLSPFEPLCLRPQFVNFLRQSSKLQLVNTLKSLAVSPNICNSYTTGTSAFCTEPEGRRPEGECVYIRQSTSACGITNMLHFQALQNLPKPGCFLLAYLYNNRYWFRLWCFILTFLRRYCRCNGKDCGFI